MRAMHYLLATLSALLLWGCVGIDTRPASDAREALAPTGKLRVGLLIGDATQAARDSSGEMKGVGYDLGTHLAARVGVPFEPVLFSAIGELLDKGKAGAWDVTFIGFTPQRAKEWDFAAPHVEVEFGYLVPSGSAISSIAEVDRAGVRIAVQVRSGPDSFLTGKLKNATFVRTPGYAEAVEMVKSGKADAIFSIKPVLFELSNQLHRSRVLDGRVGVVPQALAMPKGRNEAGITYARKFIEDAKADGLVKAAVERAGLRGVVVAPAMSS